MIILKASRKTVKTDLHQKHENFIMCASGNIALPEVNDM